MRCGYSVLLLILLSGWFSASVRAQAVQLVTKGQPGLPIVLSPQASEATRALAQDLQRYLEQISGGTFAITTGTPQRGIVLGVASDWPELEAAQELTPQSFTDRECYRLRSSADRLLVLGATEQGLSHAVWDLLYRLGYRLFLPTDKWEIIPHREQLSVDLDVTERPDFFTRQLSSSDGVWPFARELRTRWFARNRMGMSLPLATTHMYYHIIRRNQAAFDAHPEYLALENGERKYRGGNTKFCIANPGLRQLVTQWALEQFAANPSMESISMEPSDGDHWCTCDECLALGSPSNRAVMLANQVAEAINTPGHTRYVGMYAYSRHSPAPTIAVHPNVIVSVATAFQRDGQSVEQIAADWRAQKLQWLGIRDFHSVSTWNRDLPSSAAGTHLRQLTKKLVDFHQLGARFYLSQSDDGWAPLGLGHYLTARVLWDTDEAQRVEDLIDDFLTLCFGAARQPMAAYYNLINHDTYALLTEDLVGRMYRHLDAARAATSDPAVLARLDDLVLYTRYVELYRAYTDPNGPDRQQAYATLVRHMYRMRPTMMVHTLSQMRDIPRRDKALQVPEEAAWNRPHDTNPWFSDAPFDASEIATLVATGIERNALMTFAPRAYSSKLVRPTALKLPDGANGGFGHYFRGNTTFYTWINQAPSTLTLTVRGGMIPNYRDRGPARLALYEVVHATGDVASTASSEPDGETRTVTLAAQDAGLHRLELSDGGDATVMTWLDGMPMTLEASPAVPLRIHAGRGAVCVYVPRGVKVLGGRLNGFAQFRDSKGQVRAKWAKPDYCRDVFSIDVPPGEDGKLWRIEGLYGELQLLTIPPYVARSSAELLLPEEVVHADAAQ